VLASGIGETTVVAGLVPGVTCCEPTREGWLESFDRTVEIMSAEVGPPRADPAQLIAQFSWTHVTTRLLAAYRSVLATVTKGAKQDA
jgi:hypothetical protein